MYKTRVKVEVTVEDVRVVEEVAADYGIWGRWGPPKTLDLPVLLRVSVGVRARAEVDTSAGRLSEAKTQRRPRARERVRGGGFRCCFVVLYLSFSRAGEDT